MASNDRRNSCLFWRNFLEGKSGSRKVSRKKRKIVARFEWSLYKPRLECRTCIRALQVHGKAPLCRTERGCPIEDLARDKEVNQAIDDYLQARSLMQFEHLRALGLKKLEDSGLTDSNLLIALEEKIENFRKSKREKERDRIELEKEAKKGAIGA